MLWTASLALALSVTSGLAATAGRQALSAPPVPTGVVASPVAFSAISGWARDDHARAWSVWLASCKSQAEGNPPLRDGVPIPEALAAVCREALALGPQDDRSARRFFESRFAAWRIRPNGGGAFYTGYYEPEIAGSLVREGVYQTPLLDRPADLVTFQQDDVPPGFEGYTAARRLPDGALAIYPDRAAIEGGALDGQGLERAFVADPVDRFFMQVQGSGRLRLPRGGVVRFAYAGRNGHPYTSIGKVVAARLGVPPGKITMASLRAFLARDPQVARDVMRENKSFVFFRIAPFLGPDAGPIGGEGLPVTPLRSIAVDRRIWPYGLPVFVGTAIPDVGGVRPRRIRKLMIAQDTGSAIVGAARADIFFGSGDEAGALAGAVRHGGEFLVLWPRQPPQSEAEGRP
ncbi:murein transglycosylase A [Labrys monachus]|uniref:peptidoglycan lytic exotransglycosylase n=1 Tax=Labrys monachus TaxID=217067 RepID=A0ABU0FCX3_9HYPH|nr:MltA domain-containing protein [Labrys monachus]MDQ0392458.1 membrane-bound lytic murein transglycosylase A [Labrys monachus]